MNWAFRVLGALDVTGPSGVPAFGSARERTILAMLLLEANRAVPVDRLVDAVWDEAPPATARGQIQFCVFRLRRALADAGIPGRIVTRPPGYLLRVEEGELDLHAFDRLLTTGLRAAKDGRPAESAESLRGALGLFAGTPLSDVDSRIVRQSVQPILERKMAATEECLEAELTMGAHHKAIGELTELVGENPLRERLRALQMRALYRAGRPAEALAAYQEARRRIIGELGVEPGSVLRAAQMEILRGEDEGDAAGGSRDGGESETGLANTGTGPVIAVRPPDETAAAAAMLMPRMLPPDIADFAGREDQAEQLASTLLSDTGSGVQLVAVSGRGGVGKTTFALHVAHRIADQFPDGQFYAEVRGPDMRVASTERILVRFLRALGVSGAAIPDGLAECAELYRSRLAGRRVLIVLDGVTEEDQVLPLLPGSADCTVIVTSRNRLGGLPGARHLQLDSLAPHQAVTMLERMIGGERVMAEPSHAFTLARQCDGLPLALRVVSARLKARPHWSMARLAGRLSDERRRLDELAYAGRDIRASIAASYDDLSETGKRLLGRLSLCETASFPEWIPAPLLDCDPDTGAEVLETLVDAQLVDVSRLPGGVRYRMHDLVRVFAAERLPAVDPAAEQLAALRRVMSTWLFLTDEARRRLSGGDVTGIGQAAARRPLPKEWTDRIMARPLEWFDTERAALLVTIGQAADTDTHEVCSDLAAGLITPLAARGYFDDWREAIDVALPAVLRAGDRRGEAAMMYSAGALDLSRNRLDEASARLLAARRMFDELGDSPAAALALGNLASIDRVRDRAQEAENGYLEALATLDRAGDQAGLADIRYHLGLLHADQGRLAAAEAHGRAALGIAESIGNERVTAQALTLLARIRVERGDPASADGLLDRALEIVCLSGDRVGEARALLQLGAVRVLQGRHAAAEFALNQARALAQLAGEELLAGEVLCAFGELHDARGDLELAAASTWEALDVFRKLGARRLERSAQDGLARISDRRTIVV